MPCCASVNCSNSAKKGFLMKRFPRDPSRRKEWVSKMRRDNWVPTDYSFLCEIHFSPEMWEKTREDGSRKLKCSAVPTIFSFSKPKPKRKSPVRRSLCTAKKTSQGEAISANIPIILSPTSKSVTSEETEGNNLIEETEENSRAELLEKLQKYEKELLQQGFPLPSIRTLQRKLQHIKFNCGILNEVFDFLKIKVQTFELYERDCVLVLDEMAITPGIIFDNSLNKYLGEVTLPQHSGIATHVLVFMLAGITTRWKQVVAYYFTSDSVNGSVFTDIIRIIFSKVAEINLNILSITSDMGSCNQALWRTWGIAAGKHSSINNKIVHLIKKNLFIFLLMYHICSKT